MQARRRCRQHGASILPPQVVCAALAAMLLWASVAAAQTPSGGDLQATVAALVAEYEKSSKAVVGVSVRDTTTGDAIIDIRGGERFVPASNLKLLTVAGALSRLGADFQFVTSVYCSGRDVIVVGDFDPTLGNPLLAEEFHKSIYAELDAWSAAIAQRLADQSVADVILLTPGHPAGDRPDSWHDRHHNTWFGSPVAPLNFAGNCIDVTFTIAGGAVQPTLSPTSRYIRVVDNITPGRRHIWSLRANSDVSVVTLSGNVTASTSEPVSVPVDNPQLLLGRVLADRLQRAGLAVTGTIRVDSDGDSPPAGAVLVAQTTTPIAHAIWLADKHSLNMAAECLLLRAGDGTWDGSTKALTDTLVKDFGIDARHVNILDGSGLSAGNGVTPAVMTGVLAAAVKGKGGELLLNSLPLAGIEGRVADRLTEPQYRGRVLAKTGYISGSQCLSGFLLDGDGLPVLTYSILINSVPEGQGKKAHKLHDEICRKLVDSLSSGESR